jgi:hypothetical protein
MRSLVSIGIDTTDLSSTRTMGVVTETQSLAGFVHAEKAQHAVHLSGHPHALHGSAETCPDSHLRAMRRFDSASSELGHPQLSRWTAGIQQAGERCTSRAPQAAVEGAQQESAAQRHSWVLDEAVISSLASCSTGAQESRDQKPSQRLAQHQRWDSAQSDAFMSVVLAPLDPAVLPERAQVAESSSEAAGAQLQGERTSEACASHQEGQLRETDAGPASLADVLEEAEPEAPKARREAGPHELPTDERVRQPRRSRSTQNRQAPRAKRCLSAAFAAAADARRLQLLLREPSQHSACMAPTSPASGLLHLQEHAGTQMGGAGQRCWQQGTLWEALQGAANGVSDEAARAVMGNVAFGLEHLHRDGLIHRHISTRTVVLGELPCFDTARCGT